MEELKPCPFCGMSKIKISKQNIGIFADNPNIEYFAYCYTCGARGSGRRTEEQAVYSWNVIPYNRFSPKIKKQIKKTEKFTIQRIEETRRTPFGDVFLGE